ncbi:hypothetical protein ABH947_005219 [Bacillus sp. RC206]
MKKIIGGALATGVILSTSIGFQIDVKAESKVDHNGS